MVATRSSVRVGLYLVKIHKYTVNSQEIRAKLFRQLNALFKLAISIANGKVKRLTDDEGKKYVVSPQQRMKWARLAAYTEQPTYLIDRALASLVDFF